MKKGKLCKKLELYRSFAKKSCKRFATEKVKNKSK